MCAIVCDVKLIEGYEKEVREKLKAEGYPEGLVDKALELAREYSCWMASTVDKFAPEVARQMYPKLYEWSVEHVAKKWLEKLAR
ncbi:MAG: hypothetical protein QXT14_02775 [Candidatus Bathyarchaeia archaeon]